MNLVDRDHPVVDLFESLKATRQPLPAVTQRFMGDYQNGPGEMFDARYITMARCCLLGMKFRPQKWPLTPASTISLFMGISETMRAHPLAMA